MLFEFRRKIIEFGVLFDTITFGVMFFLVQFLLEFRRKCINFRFCLNFDEKSSILACFLMQLASACRLFVIGFRFEFRRKIVNFRVPFDAITCGV